MALSNIAVPKYYGMFRDAVLRGEIPVNQNISMEMNRIDALIANPGVYYDPAPVEGFIAFCENEMTLVDGSDLHLLDTFKLWAEALLCWFTLEEITEFVPDDYGGHYVRKRRKKRLINKLFLIVGRGAAKSLFETCVHAYIENVDTSTTYQMTTAPTMRQAEEVMAPYKTAIARARGPLFKFLTEGSLQNTTGSRAKRLKLASTKKGIQNFLTNSLLEVRPMSIDSLQGMRPAVASVDEWLSGDMREDPIGAIEQGASKVDDYIILSVSSEGTVRNGCGDDIKMELKKILKGDFFAPNVSIWWYALDSVDEVADPNMWLKANPNIGKTISYEAYQRDVERAENVPSARNDILAKRFGIPMEGYTYFFTYEETLPQRKREYWKMQCAMGADLSRGDDFCSFTFLFPLNNGCFGIKNRSYISELTYQQLPRSLREKYDLFIREGTMVVMDGTVLDLLKVYADLYQFINEKHYDIRAFGYDPWNAKEFVAQWEMDFGSYGNESVQQGSRTESVPLGELKKMAESQLLYFDEEIIKFTMGNCVVLTDTNGNRKLYKQRHDQKIDAISALLDAYVAYKHHRESFD